MLGVPTALPLQDIHQDEPAFQQRNKRQASDNVPENPPDPSSNTINPASTTSNPIQSPTPAVNSSQISNVPKKPKPISTGTHLSKDPKIADGSAVGYEIKKQKIKEAKEKSKNKTPKEEPKNELDLDLNNNCTLSNDTDCKVVPMEMTSSPVAMTTKTKQTTTTTTRKTTVATTPSTTMTTTQAKSTTRLTNGDAAPIMPETGNDTDAAVLTPDENPGNHTEGTIKKTYHKIVNYVNQVTVLKHVLLYGPENYVSRSSTNIFEPTCAYARSALMHQ